MVIGSNYHLIAERMDIMPRGNGTGPTGQGPGTGRGMGRVQGQGRGRMGGPFAAGPGRKLCLSKLRSNGCSCCWTTLQCEELS